MPHRYYQRFVPRCGAPRARLRSPQQSSISTDGPYEPTEDSILSL